MLDLPTRIKSVFPALHQHVNGHPLTYLDNAATTHKPESVIQVEAEFYRHDNANIHRAPHALGERATSRYEEVRERVRHFIGAADSSEIIFTKGTTESINLVANSFGMVAVSEGDEIVLTEIEHHSNIVPWQLLAARKRARVFGAKVTSQGEINRDNFESLLSERTKIVSLAHVSNALGTVHPLKELITTVRRKAPNAAIVVDGAQWVAHRETNVTDLDCDFYAFSSHKMYGPTGVGVLYGRKKHLLRMPPFLGGGDMIEKVSFAGTTFAQPPARFEAGTPNIAGVIALGASIEFLSSVDWSEIRKHEEETVAELLSALNEVPEIKIVGTPKERLAVVSFCMEGQSPMDVAVRLNQYGVAVRAGHHCCMPLMESLGIDGTVRASCSIYTSKEDIYRFIEALKSVADASQAKISKPETKLKYTSASAPTLKEAVTSIKTLFESCPDLETKQELLMELGEGHPNQIDLLRECSPAVKGCLSEVRMILSKDNEGRVFIASDSNATFVRGLLEIVERCFSGQKASEIQNYGTKQIFKDLDLPGFISVQRRSGLESVLNQIDFFTQSEKPAGKPS